MQDYKMINISPYINILKENNQMIILIDTEEHIEIQHSVLANQE